MKVKLPEDQLILAIQNRRRIGAEALYDMYAKNLLNVIYNMVKHREIAEDTLQRTIVKIWTSIDSYHQQKGKLFTWMITIARNQSKDVIRSREYQNHIKNEDVGNVMDRCDEQYHTNINVDTFGIKESLGLLKKEQRDILHMIYFKGFTHAEVAEELCIPLGTVKTRWKLGITKLQRLLC